MISPLIQKDDNDRVEILKLYNIHGTKAEKEYDYITELANSICGTKYSMVSFIDSNSQQFKSKQGTELTGNTRELAICSHAINAINKTTHIPDMTRDIRFKYHPMVTGPSNIQFYAGVPILSPEGYALGTVCVMDNLPQNLSRMQIESLVILRNLVSKMLSIRRLKVETESDFGLL